jgi:uncharacterized protein (DUF2147 family)
VLRWARGSAAGRARAWRGAALAPLLVLLQAGAPAARSAEGPDAATSPLGLWQTISDVDGKPKAYIRIREDKGELVGVIEAIIDPDKRDSRCEKCPGERRDKPVLGLTIITGMHRDGDHFAGGEILDPDNGYVYSCKITVADAGRKLDVRGYLGFSLFGRTQTWVRKE